VNLLLKVRQFRGKLRSWMADWEKVSVAEDFQSSVRSMKERLEGLKNMKGAAWHEL